MSVCRDGLSNRSQKDFSTMDAFKGGYPIINGAKERRHPLELRLFPCAHIEALVEKLLRWKILARLIFSITRQTGPTSRTHCATRTPFKCEESKNKQDL